MSFTEPASQLCEHSFARVCLCLQSIHAPLSMLARLQRASPVLADWEPPHARLQTWSASSILAKCVLQAGCFELISSPDLIHKIRRAMAAQALFYNFLRLLWPHNGVLLAAIMRSLGLSRAPAPCPAPPRGVTRQVDWEARAGGSSQSSAWHGLISLHICKLTVFRAKRDGGLRSSRGRACDSPPPHAKPQHPAGLRLACPEAQLRCGQGPRRRSSARSCAWRPATAAGATTARL